MERSASPLWEAMRVLFLLAASGPELVVWSRISHPDPTFREAIWARYFMQRHDHARHPSYDTEGSAQKLGRAIWIEPEDDHEVA